MRVNDGAIFPEKLTPSPAALHGYCRLRVRGKGRIRHGRLSDINGLYTLRTTVLYHFLRLRRDRRR